MEPSPDTTPGIDPAELRRLMVFTIKERADFPDSPDDAEKTRRIEVLADLLLAQKDKAEGQEIIGQFLSSTIRHDETATLLLYPRTKTVNGSAAFTEQRTSRDGKKTASINIYHIAVDAGDYAVIQKALDDSITLPSTPELSGEQHIIGSWRKHDDTSSGMDGNAGGSGNYDVTGELRSGIKHTPLQIKRAARERIGLYPDKDGEDPDYERRVEEWIKKTGVRWEEPEVNGEKNPIDANKQFLWKTQMAYLNSDKGKPPNKSLGRWFRDMCVMHGVSTTMLEEWGGV